MSTPITNPFIEFFQNVSINLKLATTLYKLTISLEHDNIIFEIKFTKK